MADKIQYETTKKVNDIQKIDIEKDNDYLDKEIQKGLISFQTERVYTSQEVDEILNKKYGI